MKPSKSDRRIVAALNRTYQCPRISEEWIAEACKAISDALGDQPGFTSSQCREEIEKLILCSSLSATAAPGTGLPNRINHDKVSDLLEGPVILELVHMTDIGVSAYKLERVRQDRERLLYLDRVARIASPEGQALRELDWLRPGLGEYPRKCLKLFLSDGTMELQAIELEPLPFEMGNTCMGSKIRLTNVPIIGGIAYLRNENVMDLGGVVPELQKEHRRRLYDELERRMDEEDAEAKLEDATPEGLYSSRG